MSRLAHERGRARGACSLALARRSRTACGCWARRSPAHPQHSAISPLQAGESAPPTPSADRPRRGGCAAGRWHGGGRWARPSAAAAAPVARLVAHEEAKIDENRRFDTSYAATVAPEVLGSLTTAARTPDCTMATAAAAGHAHRRRRGGLSAPHSGGIRDFRRISAVVVQFERHLEDLLARGVHRDPHGRDVGRGRHPDAADRPDLDFHAAEVARRVVTADFSCRTVEPERPPRRRLARRCPGHPRTRPRRRERPASPLSV